MRWNKGGGVGCGNTYTPGYPLQGSEVDAGFPERWINDPVHDGDEEDEGDRIEVVDQVVGDAVEGHGGGLGG